MLCLSHIIMKIRGIIEFKHEYFVTRDEFRRYCNDSKVESIEVLTSPMRDIVENPDVLKHPKVSFFLGSLEPEDDIANS